ncbi:MULTISPECIES: GerMN domain-containing protein [Cohnella]|jgi:germination protein M|uniref:GerMN domain-containing protein n=1 Tax=Cohnella TaxID=329857 RepID=UPI00257C8B3C|nr:GerMN domain-containing protein [Cohnella sp.]
MWPNDRKSRSGKLLAVALLLPLTACAAGGQSVRNASPIDPPPADVEQQMLQAAETAQQAGTPAAPQADGQANGQSDTRTGAQPEAQALAPAQTETGIQGTGNQAKEQGADAATQGKDELTVYLQDRNGYLAPMTLNLPEDGKSKLSQEEKAVAWMTADPALAEQLPQGFAPVLPQGTKLSSVAKDEKTGTVTLNFAEPLPELPAKQERKTIEALVWTMTELPGVRQVKIEIAGKPLRQLPASGIPLADVLTRNFGINLEQGEGVQASRSMAVTLYFSAQTENGEGYFVPVTRLVERTEDKSRAALQELIKGPSDQSHLLAVMAPDTTVEQLAKETDQISVSLKDAGWEPEQTVSSEMVQAVVLTVTETAGVPKVHITLNGTDQLADSGGHSYAETVTRPERINALSR